MKKNVLVLTGSPRPHGNSDLMADAFIQGAREAGHEVTKFDCAHHRMAGCIACDVCWSRGSACAVQDDFQQLIPLLEAADVLVFAFPLYWSSMPSQMKAPIDRLYAYCAPNCRTPLKASESVLLVCGEAEDESYFRDAVHMYSDMADYFKWRQRGNILAPGVREKGEIEHTDALARARALGAAL